jgi:hypothetical protein
VDLCFFVTRSSPSGPSQLSLSLGSGVAVSWLPRAWPSGTFAAGDVSPALRSAVSRDALADRTAKSLTRPLGSAEMLFGLRLRPGTECYRKRRSGF